MSFRYPELLFVLRSSSLDVDSRDPPFLSGGVSFHGSGIVYILLDWSRRWIECKMDDKHCIAIDSIEIITRSYNSGQVIETAITREIMKHREQEYNSRERAISRKMKEK